MALKAGSIRKQSGVAGKLFVSLAVLAVIAGIVVVMVPFLIDLNRYKELITNKIESAINKKVELRDIRLNLIGGGGLVVSGFIIRQPGAGAGSDIFSCENLSVRVKVLPLLAKRIEVAKIEIRAPHIRIVRDVNGKYNFMPEKIPSSTVTKPPAKKTAAAAQKRAPGVKGKTAAPKTTQAAPVPVEQKMAAGSAPAPSVPAKGSGSKPFAIEVESIQIVSGLISYRDETKKNPREISFSDLSLSVKGFQEGGDLRCKLSGILNNAGKIKLQCAVGKVPAGFDFAGAVDTLKGTLDVSLKGFDATDLIEIARDYAQELPLVKGVFDADLSVKGSLNELAVSAAVDLGRCELGYKDFFAKGKDVPCSVKCRAQRAKTGEVRVDEFLLVFGGSKLQAAGEGSLASPLKLNMTGSCDVALKDCMAIKGLGALRPEGTVRLDIAVRTTGNGVDLDVLRTADRAALIKELGDADFTVKCAVRDFNTGMLTRIQKGPVQYAGPASLDVEARGSVQDMQLTGKADLNAVSIEYPVLFSKPAGKPLVGNFNVNVKKLEMISIEKLDVAFGASKCKASGVIKSIDTLDVDMKLASRVTMSDLTGIKDVKSYGFSGGLDAALDVKGQVKRLRNMTVNGYIDIDHVKFNPPALGGGDIEIDGALKINKDLYNLQELLVIVGTSRLSVNAVVRDIDSPSGTFTVSIERLNVDEILQLFSQEHAPAGPAQSSEIVRARAPQPEKSVQRALPANGAGGGKAKKAAPAAPAPDPAPQGYLDRADLKGTFSVKELVYHKSKIQDVKTDISLKKGTLSLTNMALKGFKGTVQGSATYRPSGQVQVFDAVLTMRKVDINEILSANTKLADRIFGRLDLDLELAGKGATTEILKKQMKGKGAVDIKEGKLASIDILRNLSAISGIIGLDLPNIDDTEFRKLGMSLDIQNGMCTTNDLQMITDYFDMTGGGFFTFETLIDMSLNVLLTKEFTERLGSGDLQRALVGTDGRMSIPFTVKGDLDKPKFSPDWGDILKRQAQFKLQKMIGDKLFKKEEVQPPAPQQENIFVPSSPDAAQEKKPSTKEILTDVLIDVLSESMKKEQKPSGQQ